jgi:hypothetical protein
MPAPKFAVVDPDGKVVFAPVIETWMVVPAAPDTGFKEKLGAGVTVKVSELLLTYPVPARVTAYAPVGVPAGTMKLTVRFEVAP